MHPALLALAMMSAPETGTVRFVPIGDQSEIPERYRLRERTFEWKLAPLKTLLDGAVEVSTLTYPSPVESPTPENNTVYAEYYRPAGDGPFPGVIILDITGGDQKLSRIIATALAQNKIAGLFVQMAYYGPRRPAGSKLRLLSTNIPQTMAAVTQTVLDCRFCRLVGRSPRDRPAAHRHPRHQSRQLHVLPHGRDGQADQPGGDPPGRRRARRRVLRPSAGRPVHQVVRSARRIEGEDEGVDRAVRSDHQSVQLE